MKVSWKKIIDLLNTRVESQAFDAWIKPLSFIKIEHGSLFIEVPDSFFKEWLEANYRSLVKDAASEILHENITVTLLVNEKPTHKNKTYVTHLPRNNPFLSSNITNRYTFDNFVVGSSNHFLLLMAGFYFIALARRTFNSGQYPPPGTRVIRDTRLRTGTRAKRAGISLLVLSYIFIILACFFLYWPYAFEKTVSKKKSSDIKRYVSEKETGDIELKEKGGETK